jgi:glc operon protein GlcG
MLFRDYSRFDLDRIFASTATFTPHLVWYKRVGAPGIKTIPKAHAAGSQNKSLKRRSMPARWFITGCLAFLTIAFASGGVWAQLLSKKTLGLTGAKKMAAAAEAEAAKNKWAMVIAVLDDGGHLIYLERMDGAQVGSIKEAKGKAHTAVRFRRPSKDFEDAAAASHLNVPTLGDFTAIRGGLPVMLDGKAIGAIGVSGGTAEQDERCAEAGLPALH